MPDREFLPEVAKHEKYLAMARAFLWTLLIGLVLFTVFGFGLVIYQLDKANERLLDCIVPTGQCYQSKIRGVNQISTIDVNVAVEWCGNNVPYRSTTELRMCVNEQIRIMR